MLDIGPGCEGVDAALGEWLAALTAGDMGRLGEVLAEDFRLTCDPAIANGRMDKAQFLEFDSHVRDCKVELLSFTARRHNDTALTQIFAKVDERFEGEGDEAEQINAIVGGRTLAYASAWRPNGAGGWQCFQHHLVGPVD